MLGGFTNDEWDSLYRTIYEWVPNNAYDQHCLT